jgi:uncharacterized protein (DUF1697 family)
VAKTRAKARYVALLRGINLGPRNRVSMAKLRQICEDAGCVNVRTYIASGNVVFDSHLTAATLRSRLERDIEEELRLNIAVVVLTASELAQIVKRNPFASEDPGSLHVAFGVDDLDRKTVELFESISPSSDEAAAVVGRQIYFRLPHGFGTATLPGVALSKVRPPVTIRNWRTVQKLNQMVNDDEIPHDDQTVR